MIVTPLGRQGMGSEAVQTMAPAKLREKGQIPIAKH